MVVDIIGSSRFKDLILEYGKRFNLQGDVAIHSDVFTGADGFEISEEGIKNCIKTGHRRIVMCDQVFVVNPEGYIGDSTREEIEFAKSIGREVTYMVEPYIMKLFISLPMNGKTDEEISKNMEASYYKAKSMIQKYNDKILFTFGIPEDTKIELELINSICEEERTPIGYLAYSMERLNEATVAFFANGYKEARGCAIENKVAHQYNVPIIIEESAAGTLKIKVNKEV